eukprot:412153-Rhodomonas_salina.2
MALAWLTWACDFSGDSSPEWELQGRRPRSSAGTGSLPCLRDAMVGAVLTARVAGVRSFLRATT